MNTSSIPSLAAVLLAITVSQPGFAQDAESAGQSGTTAAPHRQADQSSAGESASAAESNSAPGEEAGSDGGGASGAASSEQPSTASTKSAVEQDGAGDQNDAADHDDNAANGRADGSEGRGDQTGPGGIPLREDYPGTDASKKKRMDTDRIEGLTFQKGDAPDKAYDARVRELETKVDDLKEKVFRSKSRIVLLKETVLSGNLSGSRAILSHENALGGAYALKRAMYTLDGSQVFNQVDKGGNLDDKDNLELYDGSISPGNHTVSVLLKLQGTGYGLFSYMDDYKFTLKNACTFSVEEGRTSIVKVRLIDKGEAFSSYEDRPGVECVVNSVEVSSRGLDTKSKSASDEASPANDDDTPAGDEAAAEDRGAPETGGDQATTGDESAAK